MRSTAGEVELVRAGGATAAAGDKGGSRSMRLGADGEVEAIGVDGKSQRGDRWGRWAKAARERGGGGDDNEGGGGGTRSRGCTSARNESFG